MSGLFNKFKLASKSKVKMEIEKYNHREKDDLDKEVKFMRQKTVNQLSQQIKQKIDMEQKLVQDVERIYFGNQQSSSDLSDAGVEQA